MLLGCDPKTLRKHFDDELSLGDAKATAKIAQTLYNKAVAGDTASLIFWLIPKLPAYASRNLPDAVTI